MAVAHRLSKAPRGARSAERLAGILRAVMVLYWAACLAVIGYGVDRLRPEWREGLALARPGVEVASWTPAAEAAPAAEPALTAAPAAPVRAFRNCAAAHAAGVYNIPMGSPLYREGQDGDGDGLACEPAPPRDADW